jgi:hypothetical protein
MAQRTKAQIAEDIINLIKDNGSTSTTKTTGKDHRILEQNLVDSFLAYEEEVAVTTMQDKDTAEAKKFLSPRRFWNGILRFITLAWTWTEKQIFNKGVSLGNNDSPSVNGDLWSDGVDLHTRLEGENHRVGTAKNKHGRVLYVTKGGNNTTAVIGSTLFTFSTIQEAVTQMQSGDVLKALNGEFTENIIIPNDNRVRHIILENATINGSFTNTTINNSNLGTITGIGKSSIIGAASASGTSTNFENVTNIRFGSLPTNLALQYKDCTFNTSSAGGLSGEYWDCKFNSTSTDFIGQYGASNGFIMKGCKVYCNNFTTQTGGIDGGANGNYYFEDTEIYCVNFFSSRSTNTIQFKNSFVKATGSSYFLVNDQGVPNNIKVVAIGSCFQTACTNFEQTTLNSTSVIDAISNKAATGTYALNPTVISALTLI